VYFYNVIKSLIGLMQRTKPDPRNALEILEMTQKTHKNSIRRKGLKLDLIPLLLNKKSRQALE